MNELTQAYARGESDVPLLGDTIGAYFDKAAARWGDHDALVVPHQDISWSWSALQQRVNDCAAGLIELGLAPGERIGIWSPNNMEWVVTQFATAKAGLILVNINPAYRLAELEFALNKVECKALITATAFKSSDYIAMLRDLAPEIDTAAPGDLRSEKLPHLRTVIQIGGAANAGMYSFDDVVATGAAAGHGAVAALADTLHSTDPINIQFTSGTTGSPKGATLSHQNILNNGYFIGEKFALTEADRMCIPVPLYHCFGMVIGNLSCLTHGAAMVFPGEAFDPLTTLETIEAARCTGVLGVPTMFIAMLQNPEFDRFDLSSLRTGMMAGSPCPVEVMKEVIDKMNMDQVTIGYGMTETSPASTQTDLDDPLERRVGSVGRVHPHVEIKIVDETGQTVAPGATGEFCARGYHVMRDYWNDEEKTAETIDGDGWMHTGDLATMDGDGYCNIVGRIKDMVIRGGENLYPREIEEYLYRHPKVADVQVFGVPDPKYGEELCAWIKLVEGEAADDLEIREFCQGQIAHQKIPRYVHFVDAFPMTVTGKAQKFVMRDQMIEQLGLDEAKTA
ncbi:MAG: AMP-binding protein [Alphaproteobacteria bacterium]|nr:AMP-binding protein [Alphaproteobacteria bacterium]